MDSERHKARLRRLLTDPTDRTVVQVPRALVASALALAVDWLGLVLLVERLGWQPVHASILSYLVGGVVQYVLCAVWVFPAAPANAAFGFMAFTVLSLGGLGITWLTMYLGNDVAGLNYQIAKAIAVVLSFAWNFLSRKYWLFRPACPDRRRSGV